MPLSTQAARPWASTLLLILGGFTILAIIATAALLKRDDLSDVD